MARHGGMVEIMVVVLALVEFVVNGKLIANEYLLQLMHNDMFNMQGKMSCLKLVFACCKLGLKQQRGQGCQ